MAVLDYSQGIPGFLGCVLANKLPYQLTKQAQRTSVGKKRCFLSCPQPLTHPIPPQIRTAEENSPGSRRLLSTSAVYGRDNHGHCVRDNFPNPILSVPSAPCGVISMQILPAVECWQALEEQQSSHPI